MEKQQTLALWAKYEKLLLYKWLPKKYVNKKLFNQKLCFIGLQPYSEISKVNGL